jgi:hypothetical protein
MRSSNVMRELMKHRRDEGVVEGEEGRGVVSRSESQADLLPSVAIDAVERALAGEEFGEGGQYPAMLLHDGFDEL